MKGKMLIVDDDPTIIKLLEKKLAHAGFTTDSVHDGQEALEKIHHFKPDIIISDIMMPRLDGYELYRKLRQNPETASIPFVFMSAKAEPSEQLEGLRLGADEYVCKPIDFNDLIERVQNVIRRSSTVNANHIRADFSGNLTRIKLIDILQLIETNLKTGEFIIKNPNGKISGKIFFRNGNLVDAQTGKLTGEEAFFELMGQNKGYFEFFSGDVGLSDKITAPNMSVLLNGTRLIDEAQGLSAVVSDTNCRLKILTREINSKLENKIGKDIIDCIFELVEKNASCREILYSDVKSKPRMASALTNLIHEKILEVQKPEEARKIKIDNALLYKIHELYNQGATGILQLKKTTLDGSVYFQDGEIIHASCGMTSSKKALFRIFSENGWDLDFSEASLSAEKSIHDPLNNLLIDATREMEGLALFNESFLGQRVSIQVDRPDQLEIPGDKEKLLTMFDITKSHQCIQDILDHSPYTDLTTLKFLLELINYKVVDLVQE